MVTGVSHDLGKVSSKYLCLNGDSNSHPAKHFEPINLTSVTLSHQNDEILHTLLCRMGRLVPACIVDVNIYFFIQNSHQTSLFQYY